jgi:hypothetical protein
MLAVQIEECADDSSSQRIDPDPTIAFCSQPILFSVDYIVIVCLVCSTIATEVNWTFMWAVSREASRHREPNVRPADP